MKDDQGVPEFIYHLNMIVRHVLPCNAIGEMYGDYSIKKWIDRNGYSTSFSSQSSQLIKLDPKDLITEVVVGHNPFKGLDVDGISACLTIMDNASLGSVLAIPTLEQCDIGPGSVYSEEDWCKIFSDIGEVIVAKRTSCWTLFLLLNHGSTRSR